MACLSMGTWLGSAGGGAIGVAPSGRPSAPVALLAGSGARPSSRVQMAAKSLSRPGLLHCSMLPSCSSALSLSSSSSFSGLSLGLDFKSNIGVKTEKRHHFVIKASKYVLCQTKRNRSRKSLARTHGFRVRMSTTSGREVLKRRRAKGRKILCTKSNPSSGKRS